MNAVQLLVLAKAPAPGLVKTRLCPPYRPTEAAQLAVAALDDTLAEVGRTAAVRRVLVLDGRLPTNPVGFDVVPQVTGSLSTRIAAAMTNTALPGTASVLVGMDTPQLTATLLTDTVRELHEPGVDAVLGPSADGGWWCLGLRDPRTANLLEPVPTSTPRTGELTRAVLESHGLRVASAAVLRDVDTAADAAAVATEAPTTRFGMTVAAMAVARLGPTSPEQLYADGIPSLRSGRSHRLILRRDHGGREPLRLDAWGTADMAGDAGLLLRCSGPTLDIGCGPGRLTAALAAMGVPVLGVDVVPAAVESAQRRGGIAMRRSLFERLPGEGRWSHVLLSDGNIGIGGDPARVLNRCAALLGRRQTALVEVKVEGGVEHHRLRLETDDQHSECLVALPLVLGHGRSADLPSALPLNYERGLLVTLAAGWLGVGLVAALRELRRPRAAGSRIGHDGPDRPTPERRSAGDRARCRARADGAESYVPSTPAAAERRRRGRAGAVRGAGIRGLDDGCRLGLDRCQRGSRFRDRARGQAHLAARARRWDHRRHRRQARRDAARGAGQPGTRDASAHARGRVLVMGYSSIEPDAFATMISSLSTAADTLQDTGSLKADCDYWGVGGPIVQINAVGAWVEAELPMLRRRLSLAQALESQAGTDTFVQIVEPPELTAAEAAQIGRQLATRLAAHNRTDEEGGELFHEIAFELQKYQHDPDVMSAFYGQLGPQYTQIIPHLLAATGSGTAAGDLEIFSRMFGVAMADADPPGDFTEVADVFTSAGEDGSPAAAAWGRLAMVQHGDFPPEWLTRVVRVNALDAFAEDPNQDFRGSGPAAAATGLSEDGLALAFSALANNPEAARSALQTMGQPDHPMTMTDLVDNVYGYARSVGTGDDIADAFGVAIESGAGVHDESAGQHSTEASRFAFEFIVASADHPDPPWMIKDSLSAVAGSYTHELAVGSSLLTPNSSGFGYSGEAIPGLTPSFTLSAQDVYGFLHGFAGDDQFTAPFDAAMGEVYMNALTAAAQVDQRAVAAGRQDPENFEKVSELFGGLAGLEYEAKEQVRGDMDEADERLAGIVKDVVTFPLNFVPADEWLVTGVRMGADGAQFLWELTQYGVDKGVGSALEVDPANTRVGQIENEEHVQTLTHHYAVTQALLDAGYPASSMPASVGSDGQLLPLDQIDPAAFQQWIQSNDGPASFLSKIEQGTLIFLGGTDLGEDIGQRYEDDHD